MIDNTALQACPFCECPPGVFLFNGTLCFKSEYGSDAYCVDSGEMFWGGTSEKCDRAKLMVYPIEYEALEEALLLAEPANEPLRCDGCVDAVGGKPCDAISCIRGSWLGMTDHYRRKPEPEGGAR